MNMAAESADFALIRDCVQIRAISELRGGECPKKEKKGDQR